MGPQRKFRVHAGGPREALRDGLLGRITPWVEALHLVDPSTKVSCSERERINEPFVLGGGGSTNLSGSEREKRPSRPLDQRTFRVQSGNSQRTLPLQSGFLGLAERSGAFDSTLCARKSLKSNQSMKVSCSKRETAKRAPGVGSHQRKFRVHQNDRMTIAKGEGDPALSRASVLCSLTRACAIINERA